MYQLRGYRNIDLQWYLGGGNNTFLINNVKTNKEANVASARREAPARLVFHILYSSSKRVFETSILFYALFFSQDYTSRLSWFLLMLNPEESGQRRDFITATRDYTCTEMLARYAHPLTLTFLTSK